MSRSGGAHACVALVVAGLTLATRPVEPGPPPPPERPERPLDQTFLTYPEWYLVFSPDEYATFIADRPPSEFPYLGALGQLWGGYRHVTVATRPYPFNAGYHVMILVIATSTTVENVLKTAYENLVGRPTELISAPTDEDRFYARYARDYVTFIEVRPWYEYDFGSELSRLWSTFPTFESPSQFARAWERRYALTQELLVKTYYGRLIMKGTQAGYEAPISRTLVRLDGLGDLELGKAQGELPALTVESRGPGTELLVTVPRYQAFTDHARALARRGARFIEIAGNREVIGFSAVVPARFVAPAGASILFAQPILTEPGRQRVFITTPVAGLADALRALDQPQYDVEHVFDY